MQSELALPSKNRQLMVFLGRNTALISAAFNGHTLVVEQLIAAGAKLDVQNNYGWGPWSNCDADCIGRTLFNPATDFSAGTLRSSWPR